MCQKGFFLCKKYMEFSKIIFVVLKTFLHTQNLSFLDKFKTISPISMILEILDVDVVAVAVVVAVFIITVVVVDVIVVMIVVVVVVVVVVVAIIVVVFLLLL